MIKCRGPEPSNILAFRLVGLSLVLLFFGVELVSETINAQVLCISLLVWTLVSLRSFAFLQSYFVLSTIALVFSGYDLEFAALSILFCISVYTALSSLTKQEVAALVVGICFLMLLSWIAVTWKALIAQMSSDFTLYGYYSYMKGWANQIPRASGVARYASILGLFLGMIAIRQLKKNALISNVCMIACFLLILIVVFLASRGAMIGLIATVFLVIGLTKAELITTRPLLTSCIAVTLLAIMGITLYLRFGDPFHILRSSGRIDHWVELLQYIFTSLEFFGSGALYDRNVFQGTASNGLIWLLLSSGFFGLGIFVIHIYRLMPHVIDRLKMQSAYSINMFPYHYFGASIIIFLLFRSIFEVSFFIIGIDQLFWIAALHLVRNGEETF